MKVKKTQKTVVMASGAKLGRPRSKHPRTSSHIPLRPDERAKLGKAAESLGLPYATWARMTLLLVADWPADKQPIRGFGPASVGMPTFITRQTDEGEERSYDGGKTWGREVFGDGALAQFVGTGKAGVLGKLGKVFK